MYEFDSAAIAGINERLDAAGLAKKPTELAVVGSTVMLAHGIKIPESDIDVVATPGLMRNLRTSPGWRTVMDYQESKGLKHDGSNISIRTVPFDRLYAATSEQVIREAQQPDDSPYLFALLEKVLSWKQAVAMGHMDPEIRLKNSNHVSLISDFILRRAIANLEQ